MHTEGDVMEGKTLVATHTLPWTWDMLATLDATQSYASLLPRCSSIEELTCGDSLGHMADYSASATISQCHFHTNSMTNLQSIAPLSHPTELISSNLPEITLSKSPKRHHLGLYMHQHRNNSHQVVMVGLPERRLRHPSTRPQTLGDDLSPDVKDKISQAFEAKGAHCVHVDHRIRRLHHEGYCKNRLWSVLHYGLWRNVMDLQWEQDAWDAYQAVNRAFAQALMRSWRPGDHVIVIGYELFLVPRFLKEHNESALVTLYVPELWPSSELFRCLPQAKEILQAMLSCDRLFFQSYTYMRHFASTCVEPKGLAMHWRGHELSLGVAVTGTDVAWTRDLCASVDPGRILALKRNFDECTLIVSVDRVDDLRGVLKKLEGYQCFWQRHHEQWRGQLKLVQIIIPAEDQANGDVKTEAAVSDLAHKLNGTYGALGNSAVIIHYSPLSDEDYVTLLQAADVYLNCSERDSIPLSVLDYAICRQTASNNAATPYILSEFVELANNLPGCSRINPWDPQQIASALHEALAHGKVGEHEEIGEREAKAQYRTRILLRYAAMFDARQWADRLMVLALGQKKFAGEPSPACLDFAQLKCDYDAAHRRIFFLDYDGTLANIERTPEAAAPRAELLAMLGELHADPRNVVMVVSGRVPGTLDEWLGRTGVGLAAEHGAFIRWPHSNPSDKQIAEGQMAESLPGWQCRVEDLQRREDADWKRAVDQVFAYYAERTPGSFVEHKQTSLTWHFRLADNDYAAWQAKECMHHLDSHVLSHFPISLMAGKKNVEVRLSASNKGSLVEHVLREMFGAVDSTNGLMVFCAGDDSTDEDMFRALNNYNAVHSPGAMYTVHVDGGSEGLRTTTQARFHVASPQQLVTFLSSLIDDK